MVKFLYWNINKKPLTEFITKLAYEHDIDFLILAESELDSAHLLKLINSKVDSFFSEAPPRLGGPIKIYSRLDDQFIKPKEDGRIAIRHIKPPIGVDFILVAVHLPSKLYRQAGDQTGTCRRMSETIEEIESQIGHTRTILIGDMNMNPFEEGMICATGVHGISDRKTAANGSREVEGKKYKYFYNPMWSYLGDISAGPPGTYFYNSGGDINFYWNIFDQVLIRPELLSTFSNDSIKIITKVGQVSLISELGRPNRSVGSDHLPILLSLKI